MKLSGITDAIRHATWCASAMKRGSHAAWDSYDASLSWFEQVCSNIPLVKPLKPCSNSFSPPNSFELIYIIVQIRFSIPLLLLCVTVAAYDVSRLSLLSVLLYIPKWKPVPCITRPHFSFPAYSLSLPLISSSTTQPHEASTRMISRNSPVGVRTNRVPTGPYGPSKVARFS